MKCKRCEKKLEGRQAKWCSQKCKNQHSNKNHLSYEAQKLKRLNRKKQFVLYLGGKCKVCGYDKCLRALSFHHREPSEKEFTLTSRELGMFKEERLFKEADKCDLLCANCHMEEHASDDMNDWKR